ncbi:MAG: HAMP domain-containing sensor histidine kinase [Bacteroidota bacterium]
MKRFLRNLILGRDMYIEDYSLYMRTTLLGYLALLSVGVASFYFFIGVFYYGRSSGDVEYATVILFSGVTLYLIRQGQYTAACLVQFVMVNGIVFYYAYYDVADDDYLYFLCCALGALVLFGHNDRKLSLWAVLFTLALFVISYTGIFGYRPRSDGFHPFFNFIFVFAACVLILQYTMRLHYHSEKITQAKNIQLQKVNSELDRFVYSASHDLRAPLSSLLGLIELARKTNDRQELEKYLELMNGRVHHLDDFIKEIIDYSRNERMEVVRQPVNLHLLVEETTSHLMQLDGASDIEIHNEVPVDMILPSDAMRLKIILNNLMNNAIKYHDQNKESRYIRILASPTGFSVTDNGMGIPVEHHDKVFNMFYRASDKSKGSGLGLYIVRESLGQLGGSVSLKSELGHGSTFTIQLPQ